MTCRSDKMRCRMVPPVTLLAGNVIVFGGTLYKVEYLNARASLRDVQVTLINETGPRFLLLPKCNPVMLITDPRVTG